jgi:hypothetical protein
MPRQATYQADSRKQAHCTGSVSHDPHPIGHPHDSQPLPPRQRSWLITLLSQRSVQVTLLAWLMANVLFLLLAQDKLPFDRPALGGISVAEQVMSANLALVEVFLLTGVVYALTRKRTVPDMAARAPERVTARRETLLLVAYGILCQLGGLALGRVLGGHAFSFHVVGSLFGTHQVVEPTEVLVWATYTSSSTPSSRTCSFGVATPLRR